MIPLEPTPYSKDYEITDAMFGAFRTPGGMPYFWKLFGWGTLLLTLVGLVLIPPSIGLYVDLIKSTALIETDPDPEVAMEVLGVLGKFLLMMVAYMIGYVAVLGIIRASFFRTYFFGDNRKAFPLEFGADELRQGLSMLGFYTLLMVLMIGISFIAIIPMVLVGLSSGGDSIFAVVVGVVLLYCAVIVAYIWFGIRFCCSGALTARNRKTHVLAAGHVSRNRFWPIFGAILVAGLLGYVAYYIAFTVSVLMAFTGLTGTDFITIMAGTDPTATLEAMERIEESTSFRISSIVAIAVVSAGYAFYSLMLAGPQAFFTRQWAESGAANYDASGSE